MRNWKIFVPIFISTFLLLLLPSNYLNGCYWDEEESRSMFAFFNQEVAEQEDFKPFYFTFDRLYEYSWDEPANKQSDNIQEWVDYHKGQVTEEDIRHFVYKATGNELSAIKAYVDGTKPNPPGRINSVVKYWKKNRSTEVIDYLIYAKQCEPKVSIEGYYNPWEEIKRDKQAMLALSEEGKNLFASFKDPFIKLRTAFQVLRLNHYAGKYEECINLSNQWLPQLKEVESLIQYWALGHKAGALIKGNKRAKASYYYAQIFDQCPSKRVPAYYSFNIKTDAEWNKALGFCKNNSEKIAMHAIRGIAPYSQSIEEMQSIMNLDPNSSYLELLLVREVSKIDNAIFNYSFDFEYPIKIEDKPDFGDPVEYARTLRSFIEKTLSSGKASNPALWHTASGYLSYVANNFDSARASFKKAKAANRYNDKLTTQLEVFSFILDVAETKVANSTTEEALFNSYENIASDAKAHSDEYLYRFFANHMKKLYEKQGEPAKAFLTTNGLYDLKLDPDLEVVEGILKFAAKSNKNRFEQKLLSSVGSNPTDALREIKGTAHLINNDLDLAIAEFEKVSPSLLAKSYGYNMRGEPSMSEIRDCIECDEQYANRENLSISKLDIAKRLQKLIKLAPQLGGEAASTYLEIGHIYYNMSFFGNSWPATSYTRSGGDWNALGSTQEWYAGIASSPAFDVHMAREYYERGLDANPDDEIAAELLYHISKCDFIDFCKDSRYNGGWNTDWSGLAEYRENFETLKQDYKHTNYYNQIIEECGYFRTYVNR